jgi:hypothetical protein
VECFSIADDLSVEHVQKKSAIYNTVCEMLHPHRRQNEITDRPHGKRSSSQGRKLTLQGCKLTLHLDLDGPGVYHYNDSISQDSDRHSLSTCPIAQAVWRGVD